MWRLLSSVLGISSVSSVSSVVRFLVFRICRRNLMPALRRHRAFTMLELMTVIAIIILVLAMAVPVVRSIEGTRSVEAGYNRVSAAIGHARQIALFNRAPAGV